MKKLLMRRREIVVPCGLLLFCLFYPRGWAEENPPSVPADVSRPSVPKPEEGAPPSESGLEEMVPLDTVVALVNGEAITLDDLQYASNTVLAAFQKRVSRELWPGVKERILRSQLEGLIDRTLILMHAKELGARVQESRVREAMSSLAEVRMAYEGDLEKFLVAKGLTYHQLFRQVEEELIFTGMVREKVLPKVRVSPAEIQRYYERNIKKFTEDPAIHCFAISFLRRDNPEEAAALLTRAREALRKINDGAYFPDVAQEYSEDPEHAKKGGDWGWITPDKLEKKASEAAFALKEGEHSGIVEGDAAYWILWVKEKREQSVVPLSVAWKEIELAVKAEKTDLEIRRWGQTLRQKAAITYPVPLKEILGR